jgi:HEPN domain-containing protein
LKWLEANVKEETKNWLDMVEYDLTTAKQMLKTGRYVYVIFMCHLAIEKTLKAIVCEETNKVPPKTHDLIYLISLGKIVLPGDLLDFVGVINNAGIVTRYPEDLSKLISSYPEEITREYLDKSSEVIKCIKQDSRLKK